MFCKNGLFTSECVTKGHPDKVCDQISDAILDACLAQDENSRVACECMIGKDKLFITGEITTKAVVDYEAVARKVLQSIGYVSQDIGFDGKYGTIEVLLNTQSPDIAQGVDIDGAGDQGMMYGYACNETTAYLPFGFTLAKKLARGLERFYAIEREMSSEGTLLRPDGKTQVTMLYEDGKPVKVDTILISTQHNEFVDKDTVETIVRDHVIDPILSTMCATYGVNADDVKILVNPTGRFVIGGPAGDAGLTGRKIIVDTYGGYAHHGGGAFSGKDPTKVDRSGAYMARKAAKYAVKEGLCDECEIQVAYAIGVAEPVSIVVNTFGTAHDYTDAQIADIIKEKFDFTPAGIIKTLNLRRSIYQKYAAEGHFGSCDAPWEVFDV